MKKGEFKAKYPTKLDGKLTKEYEAWRGMKRRSLDEKFKERCPAYKSVSCCNEWLNYENFYEWLHSQENFDKWYNGDKWAVDKDILVKGNKVYSPENCCLVPLSVNSLFAKGNSNKNKIPIGVNPHGTGFQASCSNSYNKKIYLGTYDTIEEAFSAYKDYKEKLIKEIAQIEYDKANITEQCYKAMISHKVEITD